jgi:hypothetical protein
LTADSVVARGFANVIGAAHDATTTVRSPLSIFRSTNDGVAVASRDFDVFGNGPGRGAPATDMPFFSPADEVIAGLVTSRG